MPDLDAVLGTVRERIEKWQGQGIGEQDTKATLIIPVLRALGWDTEDLEDVKLEYKRKPTDNPVDYALVLLREPRLFIEAKALGAHLDDQRWRYQILSYATVAGVEWVALTDGNEYEIFATRSGNHARMMAIWRRSSTGFHSLCPGTAGRSARRRWRLREIIGYDVRLRQPDLSARRAGPVPRALPEDRPRGITRGSPSATASGEARWLASTICWIVRPYEAAIRASVSPVRKTTIAVVTWAGAVDGALPRWVKGAPDAVGGLSGAPAAGRR